MLMLKWVAKRLIKHHIKLHMQKTMGHKLLSVPYSARDFNMAIQRFKLKKSMAALILLEMLEEDGKKDKVDEGRPEAG